MNDYVFTSESVGIGHPDKVCDRISDCILDACLAQDPESRVAVETLVSKQTVVLAGEITTDAELDYDQIVRQTVKDIGYDVEGLGFDCDNLEIINKIGKQSPDISQGVTQNQGLHKEQGAGDQGLMFGYAINRGNNLMPLAIDLAHGIVRNAREIRKEKEIDYIYPDCKSQVSIKYNNGHPINIETIVFSTHHHEDVDLKQIRNDSIEKIILPVCKDLMDKSTKILINPTGRFVVGGPVGDAGLTGRKIIVDTYGGYARHGGGAFSGKDPSKVDRSAAYAARWVAKNIVKSGIASECEVQLSYAIGYPRPLNIFIDTKETGRISEKEISEIVSKEFDLSPRGIIESLDLKRPIYKPTAFGGHFGRTPNRGYFPWEELNKSDDLLSYL